MFVFLRGFTTFDVWAGKISTICPHFQARKWGSRTLWVFLNGYNTKKWFKTGLATSFSFSSFFYEGREKRVRNNQFLDKKRIQSKFSSQMYILSSDFFGKEDKFIFKAWISCCCRKFLASKYVCIVFLKQISWLFIFT